MASDSANTCVAISRSSEGCRRRGPPEVADDKRDPTDASDPAHDSTGAEARQGSDPEGKKEAKLENHVFQTIFLDKDGSRDLWTEEEIPKEKRIYEKWWKQQSHRAQHYYKVVPWMMFLNGKNHTYFAGAW